MSDHIEEFISQIDRVQFNDANNFNTIPIFINNIRDYSTEFNNIENKIHRTEQKINYEFDINSKYVTYADRIKTYKYWPLYYHIKCEDLARAGFYYLGMGDYVKCVCCDLVLKNWRRRDDPISKHVEYNNESDEKCEFVKLFLEDGILSDDE